MLPIDETYVDSVAQNAEAGRNGRALVLQNKFISYHISEEGDLIFGQCRGSGSSPYFCSSDFLQPDKPTHRCSCPSRQIPCKHCLGLLYAYATGKTFTPAPVPEDLKSKRDKVVARVEKKKEAVEKPRKVNKNALVRKIQAQLDGIDLLERLTLDLVRLGIGNMSAKTAREIEEQAKQLGDAYLPGAQGALHSYTRLFAGEDGKYADQSTARREMIFSEALDQLGRLHTLVRQGRAYLKRRLEDPELKPETETSIAAWLGHAWQLRELQEAGLQQNDVELAQLAFNSHDDPARQMIIDTGIWMVLSTGRIGLTQNFRPYKALHAVKSDDSFFHVAQVKELSIYPGDVNPRIRWEGHTQRSLTPADLATIRKHGQSDFATAIKEVKGHLKGPLADKTPIWALNYERLGKVGDLLVAEDAKGQRLVLTDRGMAEEPPSCHLLSLVPRECLSGQTMIARFRHDLDQRTLRIKPLAIVTRGAVVRFTL